jgi:Domain of unknown function DUF29
MKEPMLNGGCGYDRDFYAWTQETAELICRGEWEAVDREHVAEEIADMGKRDKREVRSRMTVLLLHLLKWQAQPELRDKSSWRATIVEQQDQLELLFEDSPSLYRAAEDELALIYGRAVKRAAKETGLGVGAFPKECPFTLEQVLGMDLGGGQKT